MRRRAMMWNDDHEQVPSAALKRSLPAYQSPGRLQVGMLKMYWDLGKRSLAPTCPETYAALEGALLIEAWCYKPLVTLIAMMSTGIVKMQAGSVHRYLLYCLVCVTLLMVATRCR